MMKVCYSELDGPEGLSCRLEAAGHAGFAPAGQDIVCAGASTLMQALVYLLAGEENAHADAWEEPDGPRLAVQADAPCAAWVQGAFELAKAGFTLLAERYPDNIRFADVSRRGEQSMMDLQMFADRINFYNIMDQKHRHCLKNIDILIGISRKQNRHNCHMPRMLRVILLTHPIRQICLPSNKFFLINLPKEIK